LLNIVVQSNDELVIALDGKWGEGKTTFVKMWQGLMAEANVPNIYIDAFSNPKGRVPRACAWVNVEVNRLEEP
jgi:hypothetical protein